MSVEKILYRLNCQHLILAPAFLLSGTTRCPFCHEDRQIRDVEEMEWRANCRRCRYARWAGMSETTALTFASGHSSRNRGHDVDVRREQHLAATKTRAKMDAYKIRSQ